MDYLVGGEKEFVDFVSSITSKDKVGVLTHTDLDGVASAVFLNEILKDKGIKINGLRFINYKNRVFQELQKTDREFFDKISRLFILDVNADNVDLEGFKDLSKKVPTFLIDHHPINPLFENIKTCKNIIKTETDDCASLVVYDLAKKYFNLKDWEWLVCASMISDFSFKSSENLEFIKRCYPDVVDGDSIFSSSIGKLTIRLTNSLIYFEENKKKVYDLVLKKDLEKLKDVSEKVEKEIEFCKKKFQKEAEFYPKENLYFYYFNSKYSIVSIITTILSSQKDKNATFVCCHDLDNNFIKVSARNQSGKVDMNLLMRNSIRGLENATGGGHVSASSAVIQKRDIKEFKENLLRKLSG